MKIKNCLMIKKYLILPLTVIICTLSCSSSEETKQQAAPSHFVSIKNGHFSLDDKEFFPLTINYHVVLQTDGITMWPAVYKGYERDNRFQYTNRDSCLAELKKDFRLIKENGFNSIRIVGIGEEYVKDKTTVDLFINAHLGNERDTAFQLNKDDNFHLYLKALNDLMDVANSEGLKVILLARMFHEIPSTEEHWAKIMSHFKDNSTIMAYDYFNEPLYFDSLERDKTEPYYITKAWEKIIRKNAPFHLSTIGLTGIREVFEWDPNTLNVDFISFHPYEYEPNQVLNEIYWYGKYVKKPWIIGETSLPADNDSVPYSDQLNFAEQTFKQTCNCNGRGYSWWQYKDVNWFNFHSNFMGIFTHDGKAKTVTDFFKKALTYKSDNNCIKLDNYYNYSNGKICRLIGRLTDKSGKPIEGGVVLAWNQYWSSSYHTVTNEDGSFELLGTFPFYHWMVSSTMHTMKRGECLPDTARINESKIPTMNLGAIELDTLRLK